MMAAVTSVPTQVAPDGSRLRDSSRIEEKRLQDPCRPDQGHAGEADRPPAQARLEVLDEPLRDCRSALAEAGHHGGHAGREGDAFGEPACRGRLGRAVAVVIAGPPKPATLNSARKSLSSR